ncbi:ABC transporter substrate-binding protein [Clostridia bacterium]|nr:ABC transporter substrate-binding protein [Clostridia bacterium]
MILRKSLSLCLALVMLLASVAYAADGDPVKLTYYNTSAEVNAMFETMFARYNELYPNVAIELIPTGVGQGQQEKLQSLYASGNAPSFMNVDPANVLEYKEHLVPFSAQGQPWLEYLSTDALSAGTFDGDIYGVGFTTQGYGLIYNKRVVEGVIPDFDPTTINTRDALEAFFITLDEAGVPPTMLHGANWSLGSHYLGLSYAAHGPDTESGKNFIASLITGGQSIADDAIWQGYMDTFDLLVKYNYNKPDPLVGDINIDDAALATGKSATYFMGDWIWSIIGPMENRDNDFGYIPIPWSNNPEDYGNTQVAVTLPKLMCVNASQSTLQQQQAAFDMLGWMLADPEGQEFLISSGFALPASNVREVDYNSATASIQAYASAGKSINLGCFVYLTGDAWAQTGDLMLQYVVGVIDRAQLAEGINTYWQGQKPIE